MLDVSETNNYISTEHSTSHLLSKILCMPVLTPPSVKIERDFSVSYTFPTSSSKWKSLW